MTVLLATSLNSGLLQLPANGTIKHQIIESYCKFAPDGADKLTV